MDAPVRTGRADRGASGARDTTSARGARDAHLDNAKFLAVLLVAAGHAAEPLLAASHSMRAAYLFLYSFHMPLFVMVTGYFARSFDAQPRRVRRLVTGVAVPYLVFETAYTVFEHLLHGDDGPPLSLLDPWWLCWFLMCVFLWRLTSPLWRALRWPVAVAAAVSLVAPLQGLGQAFELNRLLQLLPFFVLGTVLRREWLDRLAAPAVRLCAVAVGLLGLAAGWRLSGGAGQGEALRELFYARSGRAWFTEWSTAEWLGWRVAALLVAAVGIAAFLALVPRRRCWFTPLGEGTLYAFLLHGFLVKGIEYAGVYDLPELRTAFGMGSLVLITAGLAALLCTPPVRALLRPVVEPGLPRFFRREPREAVGGAGTGATGTGTGGRRGERDVRGERDDRDTRDGATRPPAAASAPRGRR